MKKKTTALMTTIIVIGAVVTFSGCTEPNGENGKNVKGTPLFVKIEKEYQKEFGGNLAVNINITNVGKEDVDLEQFGYHLYKYDMKLKEYQEIMDIGSMMMNFPTLGPTGSYEISSWVTMMRFSGRPAKEQKYKFVMTGWEGEKVKTVLEIEFSVAREDWPS